MANEDEPADAKGPGAVIQAGFHTLTEQPDDPPVVARMVIEIRSDGTRTVARGGVEDLLSGERVTLEARGNSPLELAAKLTRSLLTMPLLASTAAKGAVRNLIEQRLLGGGKNSKRS